MRIGCSKASEVAPNKDDFRCKEHWRKSWVGVSDKKRRVPALTEEQKDYVRERDFHVCRLCGDDANEVDHIHEVADGGDNRPSNLQLLCDSCHRQKTRTSQESWNDGDRGDTSARAQAKRRRRRQGLYQQ